MTRILQIKDQIFRVTRKHEQISMAIIRFVIAIILFTLINQNIGFMEQISKAYIALILALLCAFLPSGFIMAVAAILILADFYALSVELAVITALLFVVMFFLYFRFTAGKSLYTVLTPILAQFHIPFVMPIAVGLIDEPQHVVSVLCGMVTWFLAKNVQQNAALFDVSTTEESRSSLTLAISQLTGNYEMYLYLAAFAAAAIVTYLIRISGRSHCRTVAFLIGGLMQCGIIAVGGVVIHTAPNLPVLIAGCAVSIGISFFLSLFTLSLDYRRTERLIYEDDQYSYYVKAVPKVSVAAPEERKVSITAEPEQQEILNQEMDDAGIFTREIPPASASGEDGAEK